MHTFKLTLALAALALPLAAKADVHKLVFDKALTLTEDNLAVKADDVKLKLDTHTNEWKEKNRDSHVHECTVQVKIEGRDLATRNQVLAEHYFGSMNLACDRGHGGRAFKTQFSRVLFLGMRNCVESETMVDQDYCKLVAVAMRREADMTVANGDLIKNEPENREYIEINSAGAAQNFRTLQLAPEGLIVDTLNSIQIFEFSIGKSGKDFFIGAQNPLANFAGGVNHYLTVSSTDQDRDEALGRKVDTGLGDLEAILHGVQASASPKDELNRILPDFLAKFATALKDLLAVISPVEYFGREKRLKSLEQDLVNITKTYFADTVTDRDSFVREFGGRYAEYQRVAEYFNSSTVRLDYSRITQPNAQLDGLVTASGRARAAGGNPASSRAAGQSPAGHQKLTPVLARATFNQFPHGTQIRIKQQLSILPRDTSVFIGQQGYVRCYLDVVQPALEERAAPAGYVFEVAEAQTGRPRASIQQGSVFSAFQCKDSSQYRDWDDTALTIGSAVEIVKDVLDFDFPVPRPVTQ